MLTVAISKRNKLQNIIVLTPKDGNTKEKNLQEWEFRKYKKIMKSKKTLDVCL